MELSMDVQNLLEQFTVLKRRSGEFICPEQAPSNKETLLKTSDSIIDVGKIYFGSDESWLCETPSVSIPTKELQSWLYQETDCCLGGKHLRKNSELDYSDLSKSDSERNFDSRTFTRPKKRFSRPSIEKYNEELYGSDSNRLSNSPNKTTVIESVADNIEETNHDSTPTKPLQFDLTQPTTSYYFENILSKAPEIDSFQNMSPPSLVNSMCSSTFANLMESSFIKNDPYLRQIRDTDYTETILLQDSEPPLFQSITESCSSLNSDTPESFLKKLSINGSFRKSLSKDFEDLESDNSKNGTFNVDADSNETLGIIEDAQLENELSMLENENISSPKTTGTYKRPSKYATYRKSDVRKSTPLLNTTFQMTDNNSSGTPNGCELSQGDSESSGNNVTITLNSTITVESPKLKRRFEKSKAQQLEALKQQINCNETFVTETSFGESKQESFETLDDVKQQIKNDETFVTETNHINDLNKVNYYSEHVKSNTRTNKDEGIYVNNKRHSLMGSSTGSADSLDHMSSSLSNSSRGSNRMLNMAEVDAIVEMQEKSLHIMSTPKPNMNNKKLWDNNCISPIILNEPYSDSDQSSNDDFKSARSNLSKGSSDNRIKSAKSLSYIPAKPEVKKPNTRSVNTLTSTRNLQSMAETFRGSYTNLKSAVNGYKGSQTNLVKSAGSSRGSQSNLKTVGTVLRGSYTSLRPMSAVNLPVAPPLTKYQASASTTSLRSSSTTTSKTTEPISKGTSSSGDHQFVKPAPPRTSGLPRPVGTGIPRPLSKIPGPRSRPTSFYQGRQSEGY